MRNFTPYYGVLAAALTLLPLGASAQTEGKQLMLTSQNEMMVRGHKVPIFAKMKTSGTAATSTSATQAKKGIKKGWGSVSQYDEILTEDFDKFTKGSEDNPDTEALCDEYGTFGGPAQWDIDPQYTNLPGWCGTWVFQAGGNAYLNDPTGYNGAMLNSPLGDFSGNLTITVRVKAYGKYSTSLNLNVLKGGYDNPGFVTTDNDNPNTSVSLYPGTGWKVVTFKVHNMSADNDGFIQLLSYGQCLVDYVHITREGDYIARPAMLPATDFTDSTFTVNWQKVDMAYNYWLWIYKYAETGSEDRQWETDFEGDMPKGFETNGKVIAGVGADHSKGLVLEPGDTLVTPSNFSTYKDMKFWMLAIGATSKELEAANAKIHIDLKTVNGWKDFGNFYAENWTTPASLDMDKSSNGAFNNQYYGVRIYPINFPKGAQVVIDSLQIQAGKDAELQPVGINEQYGYMYGDTKKTSYTFEDLEPDADYYYAVQSHYDKLKSDPYLYLAYGVCAPKMKLATDIDSRGSYTANWEPSVKATGYRVNNYGLTIAKEDGEQSIIDEDFSSVTSEITEATDPKNPEQAGTNKYKSLDNYTKLPGWSVKNLAFAQGWVGAINDDYTSGIMKSPALYLDNADNFKITLKAVGTAGDYLTIKIGSNSYGIPFDENGEIDGTYTIPEHGSEVSLRIFADNTFMIDRIKISQDMKAGDNIYSLLSSTTLEGKENTSATFSNLYDYEFDNYAYAVTAIRDNGANYAESVLSNYVTVNLEEGNSQTTGIHQLGNADAAAKIIGRYNVNGMQISAPQRGINLVKMSDGTVKKVLVK